MQKLKFSFNPEKNAWNIWDSVNVGNPHSNKIIKLEEEAIDLSLNKSLEECSKEIIQFYCNRTNSATIKSLPKIFNEAWNSVGNEIFKRLIIIMDIPEEEITIDAYLTFSPRCSYNYNEKSPWFMVYIFSSIPQIIKNCTHEIMHIYFHRYYGKVLENKIGKIKTEKIKEALTVLLNLEFKDLLIVEDTGYEAHREIREFIENEWKKEKNFQKLLDKILDFVD